MMYSLHDLLIKMGAPEAREKGRMEWHYFDRKKNALAGFAEIRLEAGGERLVAEMSHVRENHTDDDGKHHAEYTESFYFHAERTARPGHYRVTRISLDGDDYSHPQKGIVELGLSVFHARALDISVRMVEQVFNKQDILTPQPSAEPLLKTRKLMSEMRPAPLPEKKESWGVVIPFRPRASAERVRA
jgi:hypothetical protein